MNFTIYDFFDFALFDLKRLSELFIASFRFNRRTPYAVKINFRTLFKRTYDIDVKSSTKVTIYHRL